ncbi:hypothetical protein [Dawidia soli]|uniref:Lipocalin-like domain-containing protein n=1 Tax=Dawidia soli TaxID=2782352 RepID=A0AAP2DAI8_9BACT|nr:hypothetical protein [Dawidia soli]MBT1687977.1 hypothetical protein [Dawidia soli]
MKLLNNVYILTLLAAAILGACGGDDSGDAGAVEKGKLELLTHTWTVERVTQDDNRTAEFQNPDFTLTLGGAFRADNPAGPYTYTVAGTQPGLRPWAASGTWSFGPDATKTLVRDDGVNVAYSLDGSTLTLTFTCATCDKDNAKTGSAEGPWVFVLKAD